MDKTLSLTFNNLRYPMALFVIWLHITNNAFPINSENLSDCEIIGSILYRNIGLTITQLARLAVPTFFTITAYLLVVNIHSLTFDVYVSKLSKRVRTLLIPYILWNLLAVVYNYLAIGTVCASFSQIFMAPANFPLWFLRNLIILDIIFPLFYYATKKFSLAGLIIFTVAYICFAPNPSWHFAWISTYFFYLGIYCGYQKYSICKIKSYLKVVIIISFIILFVLHLSLIDEEKLGVITSGYILLGVISVFIIFYELTKWLNWRITTALSSSSFFIYAFHKLGPTYLAKKLFFFLPSSYFKEIIIFIFAPIVASLICVVIYLFLQRFIPRVLSVLTGGNRSIPTDKIVS